MLKRPAIWFVAILLLCIAAVSYSSLPGNGVATANAGHPTRIQCITGGPDPYWKRVLTGAEVAAKKFGAELSVLMPESTDTAVAEQTEALSEADAKKFDGLMISPLDPDKQTRLISAAASELFVATFDNETPDALTHYHVGANNHNGGRLLAQLVQKALPDGGKIAIFAGDNVRQTARIRRQVLINELGGRDAHEQVSDDLEEPIEAGKYVIVGTYIDNRNYDQAIQNARQALEDHPDLQCMVGLYSKNGPACVAAVDGADKSSKVQIVAFDDLADTLQGVRDGKIIGTVVQDPYAYGYETVRLLSELHQNKDMKMPFRYRFLGTLTIPCQIVDKEIVEQYETEQAKKIAN